MEIDEGSLPNLVEKGSEKTTVTANKKISNIHSNKKSIKNDSSSIKKLHISTSQSNNSQNSNTIKKSTKRAFEFLTNECKELCDLNLKAIAYMLKRFESLENEIPLLTQKLLLSIFSNGQFSPEECITLPQTQDKRVQIEKTKLYPHFLMYRLFINPNLVSKEQLVVLPSCKFSFDSKKSNVCINPFHYCEKGGSSWVNIPQCASTRGSLSQHEIKSLAKNTKSDRKKGTAKYTDSVSMVSTAAKAKLNQKFVDFKKTYCLSLNSAHGIAENLFCSRKWCEITYFELVPKCPPIELSTHCVSKSSTMQVGYFLSSDNSRMGLASCENPKRDDFVDNLRVRIKAGFSLEFERWGTDGVVCLTNNCADLKMAVKCRYSAFTSSNNPIIITKNDCVGSKRNSIYNNNNGSNVYSNKGFSKPLFDHQFMHSTPEKHVSYYDGQRDLISSAFMPKSLFHPNPNYSTFNDQQCQNYAVYSHTMLPQQLNAYSQVDMRFNHNYYQQGSPNYNFTGSLPRTNDPGTYFADLYNTAFNSTEYYLHQAKDQMPKLSKNLKNSSKINGSKNLESKASDNNERFVLEGQKMCLYSQAHFFEAIHSILSTISNHNDLKVKSQNGNNNKDNEKNQIESEELAIKLRQEVMRLKESCIFDLSYSECSDFSEYPTRGCHFQLVFVKAIEKLNDLLKKIDKM